MAATIEIIRRTGPAGTPVDTVVTNAETPFSDADDATPDVSAFVPKPAAGTEYSRWLSFRHRCDVTPTGTVDNLRVFTEADPWAALGVELVGRDASTGADAGYREASSDLELTTGNHTGLDGAPANVDTWTEVSPLALGGSITNPATGLFGDYLVVQAQVGTSAISSEVPPYELVFRRDET